MRRAIATSRHVDGEAAIYRSIQSFALFCQTLLRASIELRFINSPLKYQRWRWLAGWRITIASFSAGQTFLTHVET